MTAYHHRSNHHHKTRHVRRAHKTLFVLLFVIIAVGIGLGVYFWQQSKVEPAVVELKPRDVGRYYGAAKKQYTNELFQFKSTKDWQFSQENSNIPSRYVYYSQNQGIVEYTLEIYLDSEPKNQGVSYIVPVTVQSGVLMADKASPFCNKDKQANAKQAFATSYEDVSFVCDPNRSKQLYAAGVVGGSYSIPLYTSKGKLQQVVFNFVNHKGSDQAEVFTETIETFKLH